MSAFDWADFIAPLTLPALASAFIVGIAMGALMRSLTGKRFATAHLYWMLSGGAVFFVPVSLVRALEGSPIWERLLATFVLWAIYAAGIALGTRWGGRDG